MMIHIWVYVLLHYNVELIQLMCLVKIAVMSLFDRGRGVLGPAKIKVALGVGAATGLGISAALSLSPPPCRSLDQHFISDACNLVWHNLTSELMQTLVSQTVFADSNASNAL